MTTISRRNLLQFATAGAVVAMTGCAKTADNGSSSGGGSTSTVTIGTTDKVTTIDPAGEFDNGSFALISNTFPFLVNFSEGTRDTEPKPDIAESAEFTSPSEYTVKLRKGLTFANGNSLTAEDVKFSFDRLLRLNDSNGPASLLANLKSVAVKDELTAVFTLTVPHDQTFQMLLASPAGAICDHKTFPADKLMSDGDIVKANPFGGPLRITDYQKNSLVSMVPNDKYKGMLAKAASNVSIKYYAQADNLKLDIGNGAIDLAYRTLSATDIASLRKNSKVKVVEGPGGVTRILVFNFDTMPFGAKSSSPNPAKALAVRQAVASLVDRDALAKNVYKGTAEAMYGFVAGNTAGAEPVMRRYGNGSGAPDKAKAAEILRKAGITSPVTLKIQYNPDHYGASSGDEYAAIKAQIESSGLFKVDLASTEWVQYSKDRSSDVYPIYQLGWFPDFPDPDNYLTPFFTKENFVKQHYDNETVRKLIPQELSEADHTKRVAIIKKIQDILAGDVPFVPLLETKQVVVAGTDVKGADKVIDISSKPRFNILSK